MVAQNTRLIDKPNDRSLHSNPTIRGGGLIFVGLAVLSLPSLCYFMHTPLVDQLIFIFCILFLALVSFLDDLYQLSAKMRFLAQCVVALLITLFMRPEHMSFGFITLNYSLFTIPFIFIAVIWAINHFNFMDGIDGFCTAQSIFIFSAYAVFFGWCNAEFYQAFCFILVFTLIGFLIFNFPPAKLFMGDVGSATLGLISFSTALIAEQKFQIPILYWFMLNGLFLFDATITLLRRMIHKEKWSTAHKKHAYQRLRQSGVSVSIILLGQTLINASFLLLVILTQIYSVPTLLMLQLGILACIYFFIEKKFPMYSH